MEGPDQCGKTEIGKALSNFSGIPYFKNSVDKKAFANDDVNYFKNCMKYAEPFWLSYLEQSKASVIMDRGYISEAVYSTVFNRQTDRTFIKKLDEMYAKLGAYIVFCYRSDYDGWKDDFSPERIDTKKLWELDGVYRTFFDMTKCHVIHLNVDDHDLVRQTNEIWNTIENFDLIERYEENE